MLLVITQLHRVFLRYARAQARHAFPGMPHPAGTPDDLKDRRPSRSLDVDGKRLTGQIHPMDLGIGPQTVAMSLVALAPGLCLLGILLPAWLASVLLFFGTTWLMREEVIGTVGQEWRSENNHFTSASMEGAAPLTLVRGFGFIVAIALLFNNPLVQIVGLTLLSMLYLRGPFWYWRSRAKVRKQLYAMGNAATADAAGSAPQMLERYAIERYEQDERAAADNSPVFTFGEATGMLAKAGDIFAPDAGKPISISLKDLAVHLFCFGSTGSGKTFGVMRQALKWWIAGSAGKSLGGAMVLDGKGDLPLEFADIPGFTLISPENKALQYGVISGLGAEDVSAILIKVIGGDIKQDFWGTSAEQLLRNAAFVLEEAGKLQPGAGFGWTLVNLARVIKNPDYRGEVIGVIRPTINEDSISILALALQYFMVEFANMPDDTRGGVQETAVSFISPLIGHRDLFDWCNTEGGFAVEDVTRGACVGLATPEYKYGNPGMAIQALAKARVYKALRERGSNWQKVPGQTRVMILIDECQMLVGKQDMSIASVARSLGGILVFATQHVEGLREKMGKDQSESMLGNFRNLISFVSTEITHKYMVSRIGSTVRRTEDKSSGVDYQQLFKIGPSTQAGVALKNEAKDGQISAGYSLGFMPAITHEEMSAGVAMRFHATVLLNRADAPRRDLIKIVAAY